MPPTWQHQPTSGFGIDLQHRLGAVSCHCFHKAHRAGHPFRFLLKLGVKFISTTFGLMFPLIAAVVISASGSGSPQAATSCSAIKEFVGTAPSDIVQQKFAAHFDQPLNRVDCRDNGLCYQKWGKNCSRMAS